MPAQWTGRIVGELHNHRIFSKDLAKELGWHEKYLSQVMNAENPPKTAEEKVTAALNRLIEKKNTDNTEDEQ